MTLRLSKSRRILREGVRLLKKRGKRLTESEQVAFERDLKALDRALLERDRERASDHALSVARFIKTHFPKTLFDHTKELVYALLFALIFAFLIRDLWFELYEVPTGSMRPTIEELDRLVVSKTTFGLHLPLQKGLILHRPEYIQRQGTIVFTVEDMDVPDSDTRYFYLFPGKKRFVKRCLGKPGDTLYFYGGELYGIDREGEAISFSDSSASKSASKIDHIPFITFEGRVQTAHPLTRHVYSQACFSQMNLPVARLTISDEHKVEGEFFNGTRWVAEDLALLQKSRKDSSRSQPTAYADLWGIGNYAMARLLSWDEVTSFYPEWHFAPDPSALLYLELHHTPNLTAPSPELRQGESGLVYPALSTQVALIPLTAAHLQKIQQALFTARFHVVNGRAYRYHEHAGRPQAVAFDPRFVKVPNGCYEFYYGKGYRVGWGGILSALPPDHPLYSSTPEHIKKLFNLGIGFNLLFNPVSPHQPFLPQRFAYFKEGDLYLMGAPILTQDDPTLIAYVQREKERSMHSSSKEPYIPFIDQGPPCKEGKLDTEFIRAFGLKIPDDSVLALGDNYAMSADSRDFGFVPVSNLRGAPAFTFWPPGPRLGALAQPPYPWVTLPRLIVWGSATLIIAGCFIYIYRRNRRSYFKDL